MRQGLTYYRIYFHNGEAFSNHGYDKVEEYSLHGWHLGIFHIFFSRFWYSEEYLCSNMRILIDIPAYGQANDGCFP